MNDAMTIAHSVATYLTTMAMTYGSALMLIERMERSRVGFTDSSYVGISACLNSNLLLLGTIHYK